MKQYEFVCGECKGSTIFNKNEIDIDIVYFYGGDSYAYRTSYKNIFCQHCGRELDVTSDIKR